MTRHPEWYSCKTFNNITDVLRYTKPGDDPSNWKKALPRELIGPTVNWYHQVTGHPGSKRPYSKYVKDTTTVTYEDTLTTSTVTIVRGIN
jgi:hypothetical protein